MVLGVLADMLRPLGYAVITVTDGRSAVELYRARMSEIQLVILDVLMPDMDGVEVFRQLRAINPKVRALVSSGFSLDSHAQALVEAGAIGFLPKPFGLDTLANKVAKALQADQDTQ
jgi:CheY-like chemotaxis protein